MSPSLISWGKTCFAEQDLRIIHDRSVLLPPLENNHSYLPYGQGRSYGDSCLNNGGMALLSSGLDRFIAFDPRSGVLRCESGILLSDILDFIVPQGWFLPVTPGTRFVSLGGAIANDVHGKNHHVAGTLGMHIKQFELIRSDQQRYICSQQQNHDLFCATIGGLGLTGMITWAEIQLKKIASPWLNVETIKYGCLNDFFALCKESDLDYEYSVSWIDCLAQGKTLGRGLFMRANHAAPRANEVAFHSSSLRFPFEPPVTLVNSVTLRAFNALYYHKQHVQKLSQRQHYQPYFYPLDGVLNWNRLYGRMGFYQYQCVIPMEYAQEAMKELLRVIARTNMGSFLAVLKMCGKQLSPGMMSFPMEGVSLALDFPNLNTRTDSLFNQLDKIVESNYGRLYPAKDAKMPGSLFRQSYPNWETFSSYIDPKFSSSFWRRVME